MDSSHSMIVILILILLIILSGVFSSTETAYSSLNLIRVKQMAKNGNHKAKTAYNNTKKFTALITTILIGNNIVNTLATSLATMILTSFFGESGGIVIATGVMTFLILIFGEVGPKIIAKAQSEKVALFMAQPLKILMFVFRPICYAVEKVEQYWEKNSNNEQVTATEDELLEIVSTIEQEGVLEQEERELIESVIEFDDKYVRDIMVSKEDVKFVYDNTSFEQLKEILSKHKLSRLPVLSYDTAEVIGILRVRDVLDAMLNNQEIEIKELMRNPVFVTQRKKLPAILEEIQKSREHMLIVTESLTSNVFVGILTLEDVLEELVGEIYDEYDPLPNHVFEIGLHTFQIDGNVNLIEFFDTYAEEQEAPKTKARTFSSWIYELNQNRKVRKGRELEFENLKMKVLETKDGVAVKIELQILSQVDLI